MHSALSEDIFLRGSARLYFLKQLKRAGLAVRELRLFYLTCVRPLTENACPVPAYVCTYLTISKSCRNEHFVSSFFICPTRTFVLPEHLSYQNICPTRIFVLPEHLSYQNICPTRTFVLPEHLSYQNICPTRIFVLPEYLSYQNICPTRIFVLPEHLSYQNICPTRTFVLPEYLSYQNICPTRIFVLPEYLSYQNICPTRIYSTLQEAVLLPEKNQTYVNLRNKRMFKDSFKEIFTNKC